MVTSIGPEIDVSAEQQGKSDLRLGGPQPSTKAPGLNAAMSWQVGWVLSFSLASINATQVEGLSLSSRSLISSPPDSNTLAELQINKNWMVKSRVGTTSAAASVGLRAWFEPSVMMVGTMQYMYFGSQPKLRWGLRLQVENFGDLRCGWDESQ